MQLRADRDARTRHRGYLLMVRLTRREALLLALRDMERKEAYG
jgi:hypothetical protein